MPRLLAIDYGTKRCGIAVSDPLQIIANGLTTVHAKDLLTYLETYLQKEAVELIIVGEPKNLKLVHSGLTVSDNPVTAPANGITDLFPSFLNNTQT